MTARSARSFAVRVCIEATPKRTFASALDWPGWCRAGKDEASALADLLAHAPRYALVAKRASLPFAADDCAVVERVPGNATTEYGAPAIPAAEEGKPLSAAKARRMASLVAAAWAELDGVVAGAPTSLRKGPRGGGRDRDPMVEHVLAAEQAYARKLGVRVAQPHVGDAVRIAAMRDAILELLVRTRGGDPPVDRGWPPRYAARRIAWHALDHAWEMENRTER